MGISDQLAKFVAETNYEDIPLWVIETQKKSILDSIAITLGAAALGDGCRSFVDLARENSSGGAGEATVIGFGEKMPASWAAFANAAMAHSLDFGDTQMDAVVHSNASTFPAALAMAEKLDHVDGKRLLTALVLGSEVACRISIRTAKGSWHYFYEESPDRKETGYEELRTKLKSCAEHAVRPLSPARLGEIESVVKKFEALHIINEFTKLL